MKIVIDENIAFGKKAFSQFGDVVLVNGRKITNDILKDADILIVRSVTKVDKDLLKGTKVRFVGTATIGTDHIDKDYLSQKEIAFTDAAGCNSYAVTEYVFTAIWRVYSQNNITLKNKSIGIIGVGNIGSKVKKISEVLGLKTILNDPPLQRKTGDKKYTDLQSALSADVITLHVPLNESGVDKTFHLLNEKNISLIKKGSMLINTSRGAVVDNIALLKRLKKQNDIFTVFDVWENEPAINYELLNLVTIATPHIAGYSYEGKVNGTVMIYEKLCEFLNEKPKWEPPYSPIYNNVIDLDKQNLSQQIDDSQLFSALKVIFEHAYNIENDSSKLKASLNLPLEERAKYFDLLRKEYPLRRELNNYFVKCNQIPEKLKNIITELRLKIV
ncbi:4-phosphoerythronate dehydrogenase [Melioribacteraceae bacterium 4301-Me]|uniref:4-phosphoerythronate dehydrogenase n=1 Tax=Pyranulibacter aquaticus TaxID=3163344 RepID=UPI003595F161